MAHQEYQEWILGRLRGQPEPPESVTSHGKEGVSMPSPEHRSDLARRLTMLFVVAVLVSYPWERMQSQLYFDPGGAVFRGGLCLAASLTDACSF